MVKINRKVGGSNPPIPTIFISGISSVWLERVIWDHEAVGSSPTSPTNEMIRFNAPAWPQ